MTQEEFNQQYMHYYLGSGVRTKCVNKNSLLFGQLDWLTSTAYSIHNGKTGAVAMILKDLVDMSAEDCLQLVDLSQLLTGQVDNIEIYKTHIECDCTDKDQILPFKFHVLFDELNPKQFDYLLKKGYNLFDPEWKFTIKAE